MLCLPCDTDKHNYKKGIVIILITVVSLAAYAKLTTDIVELKDWIAEASIVQVLLAVALLSIGFNLSLVSQCYSLHNQIKKYRELIRELCHQRDCDMLSGLKNRNAFTRFAEQIEKEGIGVSVIFCDIDGLKIINDTLGHVAGDSVIRKVGEILRESSPSDAHLFRIGGDEYIMVFTRILTEEELKECKKLIKERIVNYNTCHPSIPLSMSIGFAATSIANKRFWDVVQQADYNMYQEKHNCKEKV